MIYGSEQSLNIPGILLCTQTTFDVYCQSEMLRTPSSSRRTESLQSEGLLSGIINYQVNYYQLPIINCQVLPPYFSSCDSPGPAAPTACPHQALLAFPELQLWAGFSWVPTPALPLKHLCDLGKFFYLLWKMGQCFLRWWLGTRCSIKISILKKKKN